MMRNCSSSFVLEAGTSKTNPQQQIKTLLYQRLSLLLEDVDEEDAGRE